MKKDLYIIIAVLLISVIGAWFSYQKNGSFTSTIKSYHSPLGFVVEYPGNINAVDIGRYVVLGPKDPTEIGQPKIIISLGLNDEGVSAEDWLLGSNSGYKESMEEYGSYQKVKIGGQDGVCTKGGMWCVVNAPDDSYRLSFADLKDDKGERLYSEMKTVIERFKFD